MNRDDIGNILKSFDPTLPLEEASTLPSDFYTHPAIAEIEKKNIFHDSWQYVGSTHQLEQPGSFINVDIAGEPVLIVKNKNNELNAFSNVCRHRAARVECRNHGKTARFRCRYHGWAYDLNGQLCGTPDFNGVANFELKEQKLPNYAVETWGPFVFVNLSPKPKSFADFIAPLQGYEDKMMIKNLKYHCRRTWTIKCNWKLFVDNYQDGGYHINTVHPDLAKVVNMDTYDIEMYPNSTLQLSPLKAAQSGAAADDLNTVRKGDVAYYWWFFPNFMINAYEGTMDTNLVLPIDENTCLVIFDYYFEDTESSEAKSFIEKSLAIADQVQDEDIDVCEEVQRNLRSHSFETGRFSVRREAGGYLFHQILSKTIS